MTSKFEPGSYVWIEDEEERYLPAKVLKGFTAGEAATLELEDGEERKLTSAESKLIVSCNQEALNSKIEDLIEISDLNEMSILHVLRIRFKKDRIYTNISAILISVNPFKLLPLYTPEMLDKYRNGPKDLPPHVFGTAYTAYNYMMAKQKDQSVVISGESGAGKSEATKLILQFITDVSARASAATSATGTAGQTSQLEQQILAANPILEAFGNAKTLRNNNSSRFGKLITVNFDRYGSIVGGGIINYLLEKSRVVGQTIGERNYHIFYQLLSTTQADPKRAAALTLSSAALFDILNPQGKGVTQVDGISDEKDFEDVLNSFRILGFNTSDVNDVCKIVAGVLHFGNIKFKAIDVGGDEGSEITTNDSLATACALWGLPADGMKNVLTSRAIKQGGEVVRVAYSVVKAYDARDAMMKRVYAELFQIMVNSINKALASEAMKSKRQNFIGVLDIFGFESFAVNSFEQLCINFCNEKLQYHFNEHIFKMEITLYAAEGITIAQSAFVDNQPTLDMLELPTNGIFSMIDEECIVPKGSDEGLLSKVFKAHNDKGKEHPNMIRPKNKDCLNHLHNFGILHYAGPVFYDVSNFLEKNRDTLHEDIIDLLKKSSMSWIRGMFPEDAPAPAATAAPARRGSVMSGAGGVQARRRTLGGQFKTQLNELISTLNATYPHFVRCMKSNDLKVGNNFNATRMQAQLRYAGLVEVCRIRKLGYPVRLPFDEFFKRFKCCALQSPNLDAQLAQLQKEGVLIVGEWAKGKSRVFLRMQQSIALEAHRELALTKVAVMVQSAARRFICRIAYARYKVILEGVQAACRTRTEKALKDTFLMLPELPYSGAHLAAVKDARKLLSRVVDENRVKEQLRTALESQDLNRLEAAVAAAAGLNPPLSDADTPYIAECKKLIKRIEELQAAKAGLLAAITKREIAALAAAIAQAQKVDYHGPEISQAAALKTHVESEEAAIAAVVAAVATKDLSILNAAIEKAQDLGLTARAEVKKALETKQVILDQMAKDAALKAELERQRAAEEAAAKKRQLQTEAVLSAVKAAIESCKEQELQAAIEAASNMGLKGSDIDAAERLLANLRQLEEAKSKIDSALKFLAVKAVTGLVTADLDRLKSSISGGQKVLEQAPNLPFPELVTSSEKLASYKTQASINERLIACVDSGDRALIRKVLDEAENLAMTVDAMDAATNALRQLEEEYRAAKAEAGESYTQDQPEEQYDAAEEARLKRQELAAQPKYAFQYFRGLRSSDDFARGVLMNKNVMKSQHLVHQTSKLPRSITDLPRELSKRAIEIHQNLLGYMGDKQMPFPAMLAQDLLKTGFEKRQLRDEIYCQIIKQLTNNPRPESSAKGWQIMCMCVGTFPPSFDFEMYLMHYILERRDTGRGVVVDFAKYCLRTLEAMLSHGEGAGYVPQVEEILAFKERPPVLATISLVDGANLVTDLPVTPDTNVLKILEMCIQWTELFDTRVDSLGLFVYDMGDQRETPDTTQKFYDLERTPRPLRNDEFLGDVVVSKARQKRNFRLVFKKKLFLPAHNYRGEDPGYDRLLFLQAEDETIIQGNIELPDEETTAYLAAVSMAVCHGTELGQTVDDLCEQNVQDFVALGWREKITPEEWAELVLAHRPTLIPAQDNPEDPGHAQWFVELQWTFVETVMQSPMYGMHWVFCHPIRSKDKPLPPALRNVPNDMALAFNCDGMHVFGKEHDCLASYTYADIFRWGGGTGHFSIIIGDEDGGSFDLSVVTAQANDLAGIILDHIQALMAASGITAEATDTGANKIDGEGSKQ